MNNGVVFGKSVTIIVVILFLGYFAQKASLNCLKIINIAVVT